MSDSKPLLGNPQTRVDGRLKVTGRARYAADTAAGKPGRNPLAHAVAVGARIAKGRIAKIEVADALAAPGALAAYTHENRPKIFKLATSFATARLVGESLQPLAGDRIHFFGQIVAVVVAGTLEEAERAARLVRVTVEEERPVLPREPFGNTRVPARVDGGPASTVQKADGVASVAEAFEAAEVKLRGTYTTPLEHHHPMEPHATVAEWDGDRLTVHEPSQWVVSARNLLADAFGLPEERVRVVSPFVGGAFGGKGALWHHTFLCAAAARELGRPVKLVLERAQMFTGTGHRPATRQEIFLGAKRDGVLTAMRHLSVTTTAEHHEFVEPTGHRTTARLYACPNVEIAHALAEMPVGAPTYMRAPGEAPGLFALESALDELSWALAMDPVALRLANHAEKDPKSGKPWSAKALKECYRAGAERFGWKAKRPDPRSQREGEWLFGQGMASAIYPGYRAASTARVRILESGRVQVSSATHDLGTGMYTLLAQVVGDALSLPLDAVDVELGDSSLPPAALAGGSMSTASVLPAVRKAAEAALAKLVDLAVSGEGTVLSGLAKDAVAPSGGRLVSRADPSRAETFSAILARAGKGAVEATETAAPGKEGADFAFSSFGAHFVAVGVDRFTCEVRVHRVVSAMSIGAVLNPKAARSQVIGGVVGGIGMALLEETRLDAKTGRLTTLDLSSYRVPVNADVPPVDVLFVGEPDIVFNPLGARGVGEIGITGVAAAVANAVYHATGQRVRDLPITPEKLLG